MFTQIVETQVVILEDATLAEVGGGADVNHV